MRVDLRAVSFLCSFVSLGSYCDAIAPGSLIAHASRFLQGRKKMSALFTRLTASSWRDIRAARSGLFAGSDSRVAPQIHSIACLNRSLLPSSMNRICQRDKSDENGRRWRPMDRFGKEKSSDQSFGTMRVEERESAHAGGRKHGEGK